jgi:hypothetical protein
VFVITTILQHRAVTYKDILDADLVVVSFSFLVYVPGWPDRQQLALLPLPPSLSPSPRISSLSFTAISNKNYGAVRPSCHPSSLGDDDPKLAQRASPVLTQFRWLRMVLDEAHELPMGLGRKGKTGIDDIAEIQATFRSHPPPPTHSAALACSASSSSSAAAASSLAPCISTRSSTFLHFLRFFFLLLLTFCKNEQVVHHRVAIPSGALVPPQRSRPSAP